MRSKSILYTLLLALTICVFPVKSLYAGGIGVNLNTDNSTQNLVAFFDLRDRESFVQVTNLVDPFEVGLDNILHIQIFNVDQNCNENNFFDVYTPNDTHVYNLRDIITNDGNPSGVVLPDDAYGFVAVTQIEPFGDGFILTGNLRLIGNFRIIDNNGYEYRTNMQGTVGSSRLFVDFPPLNFNFNNQNGVILSDIAIFPSFLPPSGSGEFEAADITSQWLLFDVDILDLNENIFSCRNIISACTDQDNPLIEELLEVVAEDGDGGASVAAFEWGINEAIPHSKGGELLCPGNNIEEGFVYLALESTEIPPDLVDVILTGYVGLNNGNGRGSMDSIWIPNLLIGGG